MSRILQTLIAFQTQLRFYHWSTKLYARHVASGTLYTSLDALTDKFVETLQGLLPGQRVKYNTINFTVQLLSDDLVIEMLDDFSNFLTSDIDDYLSSLKNNTSDLKNIRDEMLSLIHQTKYMFSLK
jgi:hypothetical protein